MRERTKKEIQPRMTDIAGAMFYIGMGRNSTLRLVRECGAAKRVGRRLLVDLRVLDAALDALPEDRQNEEI